VQVFGKLEKELLNMQCRCLLMFDLDSIANKQS